MNIKNYSVKLLKMNLKAINERIQQKQKLYNKCKINNPSFLSGIAKELAEYKELKKDLETSIKLASPKISDSLKTIISYMSDEAKDYLESGNKFSKIHIYHHVMVVKKALGLK